MIFKIYSYSLPFRKPFLAGKQLYEFRKGFLFSLNDGEISAFGDAAPLPGFSLESFGDVYSQLNEKIPEIARLLELPHRPFAQDIDELGLHPSLAFGLDTLIHHYNSIKNNETLSMYLFGTNWEQVLVNGVIGKCSPEDCIPLLRDFLDENITTVKLKVGNSIIAETKLLEIIKSYMPEAKIRIDANEAWTAGQAIKVLESFKRYPIEYCEQPVSAESGSLGTVRKKSPIPIAADESFRTLGQLEKLLRNNECDVIVAKPALLGSFYKSRVTYTACLTHSIKLVFSTILEGYVGRLATAHLAAGFGSPNVAHGLHSGKLLASDYIKPKDVVEGGSYKLNINLGNAHNLDMEHLTLMETIVL